MKSGVEQFVPLSQANSPRIRTEVDLPFDLSDKVGLHVGRTHLQMQIGGIRHLKIVVNKHGNTSQMQPQIVGMDTQGNAIAGKAIGQMVPPEEHHVDMDDSESRRLHNRKQSQWMNVTISLNLQEILQRIRIREKNARSPEAWSLEIDSVLKKVIFQAGKKHLLSIGTGFEKYFNSFLYTFYFSNAIYQHLPLFTNGEYFPSSIVWETFLLNIITAEMVFTVLDSIQAGVEQTGKGRRISLFFGSELDRALCLWLLNKNTSLVKPIPR